MSVINLLSVIFQIKLIIIERIVWGNIRWLSLCYKVWMGKRYQSRLLKLVCNVEGIQFCIGYLGKIIYRGSLDNFYWKRLQNLFNLNIGFERKDNFVEIPDQFSI